MLLNLSTFTVLLSDENVSIEEQGRLKVAFAEGYLAADPQKNPSKASKTLKLIQSVLAIIVFIAILFSLMGIHCFSLIVAR